MNNIEGTEAKSSAGKSNSVRNKAIWSVAIVMIMIVSAFVVMAYAQKDPTIWASKEPYALGEKVQINGKGWSPNLPVTVVMTHPEFASKKTYLVVPESNGSFACDNYTAEGVDQREIPISVTATQVKSGVAVKAVTQFHDPAMTLKGYRLLPHPGWTAGDVKGYNEGDSVPFKMKLEKASLGSTVVVTLGFDFLDVNKGVHGIDYLTQYHIDPPTAPFNTYPKSTTPFWVDPSEGTITSQVQLPNQNDSGVSRNILVWQFTLQFAAGSSYATVRWGAHMAVSDLPNNYYGASYFPGESLHVRIVALDPSSNKGNRDVPISLNHSSPVLTPPKMTLDKWVEPLSVADPQVFKIGDTITFTIMFSNIGQADASCAPLNDYLPSNVAYVIGSSVFWTSEKPNHVSFPPAHYNSTWLEWSLGSWRGTGENGEHAPLVGYIQFQAIVLASATPGIYWNNVYLSYSDNHGGVFDELHAKAPFEIVTGTPLTIKKSGPLYAHVTKNPPGAIAVNSNITAMFSKAMDPSTITTSTFLVTGPGSTPVAGKVTYSGLVATFDPTNNLAPNTTYTATLTTGIKDLAGNALTSPIVRTFTTSAAPSSFLGTVGSYAVLAGSAITNTGMSVIIGNLGLSPGTSVTGFPPGIVNGIQHIADAAAAQAKTDLISAYNDLAGRTPVSTIGTELGGTTVYPGVYNTADSTFGITGTLTLDAMGNSNAVFVFKTATTLTTAASSKVVLTNGAQAGNVYWQIGSSATIGANSIFKGSILAMASITLGTGANIEGQVLARNGAVTLDGNVITLPGSQVIGNATVGTASDAITYTYTITNSGPTDIVHLDVYDDVVGWIVQNGTLAHGTTVVYTKTYTITALTPDPLHNIVTANGKTPSGGSVPEAKDDWTVDILHPSILVQKTADKICAKVGESVTYTITYKNTATDGTVLYNVTIADPMLGIYENVGKLNPGQSGVIHKTIAAKEIVSDPNGEMPNTVTAIGYDMLKSGSAFTGPVVWNFPVGPVPAAGQAPVVLGTAGNFAVLAGSTITNTGMSVINGDLGLSPGTSVTGFPPGVINGTKHVADAAASQAKIDLTNAYNDAAGRLPVSTIGTELGGTTVYPGVYNSAAGTFGITGTLTLDAKGDANAVFVFKAASTLITASSSKVVLTNGAQACNIFWQVGSSATLGTNSIFKGSILAMASITVTTGANVEGRLLARNGAVTLDTNFVSVLCRLQPRDSVAIDTATWIVDIKHPGITIDKWATNVSGTERLSQIVEGDVIQWHIMVTNPSSDTAMYYNVSDPLLSNAHDDRLFGGMLNPGASYSWTSNAWTVPDDVADPLVNTAWVIAYDNQEHYVHADTQNGWPTAIVTLDVLHPEITINKWATYVDKSDRLECVAAGDVVVWHVSVFNPSSDTWMNYRVVDAMIDTTPADPLFSGRLAPRTGYDWTSSGWTVPVGVADPLINTATVVAWDDRGNYVFDEHGNYPVSTVSIDVLHPAMTIEKWATSVGETARLVSVAEGDVITWHISVFNPSSDTWMNYEVWDSMIDKNPANPLFTGRLAPGTGYDWTSHDWTVPVGVENPLNNTAYVVPWDDQFHYIHDVTVSGWPEGTVELDILPAITIEKWATYENSEVKLGCVAEGDMIIWHIKVANPNEGTTMSYDVYDPTLSLRSDDWLFKGTIGAEDSYTWTSEAWQVPAGVADPLVNTAWVAAYDSHGNYVHDSESANGWPTAVVTLDVLHPGIVLEKWATYENSNVKLSCVGEGDMIIWHIKVTNPSADTVMYYNVYDPMISLESNDWLFNGDLSPGGTYTWTSAVWKVPADVENPLVNTAWVVAYDNQDHYVHADTQNGWPTATVSMEVLHPQITVVKVGPEWADAGSVITYTVTVTNVGDTKLFDVSVSDSLKGDIGHYAELAINDPQTITYTMTVPAGPDPLVNSVEVRGTDKQGHSATDTDTWTVQKTSTVTGYKLVNLGNFGTVGVNQWTVRLQGDLSGGGVYDETRITNSNGYFEFLHLQAGSYTVSEIMQAGWTAQGQTSYSFSLGYGTTEERSFANMPTGSISGSKFHDTNLNGVWDLGEEGVSGWTINLDGTDATGAEVHLSTTSGTDGGYSFVNLSPGLYTVSEGEQTGWFPTTQTQVAVDVSALNPFAVTGVDFGNAKYGQIIGAKWIDEFMNGIWDGGEKPVAGWTIWLEGQTLAGEHVGPISTTTGANGWYAFTGLKQGTYTVWENLPDGWVNITHASHSFTLVEGSVADCGKFGNVQYGSIPVSKFLDWDMDTDWDPSPVEPGIPGWKITLTGVLNDENGTVVGPIVKYTDANGETLFDHLLPGKYTVTEEMPATGWVNTNYVRKTVNITSGYQVPTHSIKFANVPYSGVWGYKFDDKNGNGLMDAGEVGIAGWTITITGTQANGVAITPIVLTTDATGKWQSSINLLPGHYTVTEASSDGWVPITAASHDFTVPIDRQATAPTTYHIFDFGNFKMGKIWGYKYEDMNGNGVLDAGDRPLANWLIYAHPSTGGPLSATTNATGYWEIDGLPAGECLVEEDLPTGWQATNLASERVTIESHSDIQIHTFLNTYPGTIWGYKFEDMNGNGIWDLGESGISGWVINLMDGDVVVKSTTTDATGYYQFANIWPDEYTVEEASVQGWVAKTPTAYDLTVKSSDAFKVLDFGNWQPVWIKLFKFEDMLHDGSYDPSAGDAGMVWTFTVSSPSGIEHTVTTDSTGYVSVFLDEAGVWTITEASDDSWSPTTSSTVEVNMQSGHAYNVATDEEQNIYQFGNFKCVTVTVFKYEDVNSDGLYDPAVDTPISGWRIMLHDSLTGRSVDLYTTDDGSVSYTFCDYGIWSINEEMPSGWAQITPQGGYEARVVSGHAYNTATLNEQSYYTFGNFHGVEIQVFKYWDKCSNGWYDPELNGAPFDVPLKGWYFELRDASGNVLNSGTTDENGKLSFWVWEAGTYTVVEKDVEGWSHISPLNGMLTFDIQSGDDAISASFGNYEIVKVPVFKYEDVDSNGQYDPAVDRPLGGWHFDLVRSGDNLTFSGVTDASGNLVLNVNRSGTYVLTEENRDGWIHVNPSDGSRAFSLTSGTVIPTQMFGNFQGVEIQVFKYWDKCSNGWYDPELNGAPFDVPIKGWYFELRDASGNVLNSGTTDENGKLSFWVWDAGTYTVVEKDVEGWSHISPLNGMLTFDIQSGDDAISASFGNYEIVKVPVFKYEDMNGNGVYDQGVDQPLSGWHFDMVRSGDGLTFSGVTDANGNLVLNVNRSGTYVLTEQDMAGWTHVNPVDGSRAISLTSGTVIPTQMFGNFRNVQIPVFKFDDISADGIYDPQNGDVPVVSWTFQLWEWSATTSSYSIHVDTKVTDGTGHAVFTIDHAGKYIVTEDGRDGWLSIYPASGTYNVTAQSGSVSADPQMRDGELQFANFKMGRIYGHKWNDLNGNGIWDNGEPPLQGWTIHFKSVTNFYMEGSVKTDANGYYEITGLPPASYDVWEDAQTGWTSTSPARVYSVPIVGHAQVNIDFLNFETVCIEGYKHIDTDGNGVFDEAVDPSLSGWWISLWMNSDGEMALVDKIQTDQTGHYQFCNLGPGIYQVTEESRDGWIATSPSSSGMITLQSGQDVRFDFLNFEMGRISGYKFEDSNSNGVWDQGEPGIVDWPIHMIKDGESTIYTTLTVANGAFSFENLMPGKYMVYEDVSDTQDWTPTTTTAYNETIRSGSSIALSYFGNFRNVNVTAYKYEDVNSNGVYDTGDKPIMGWGFEVRDSNNVLVASLTTDANGLLSFTFERAGVYTLSEASLLGWEPVSPASGSASIAVISGHATNLATDLDQDYYMFGNFKPGSILGGKIYDWSMNGLFDGEDYGIQNWVITLHGDLFAGGTVDITRLTGSDGSFRFDDLRAGVYTVAEQVPVGWHATSPASSNLTIHSGDSNALLFSNVHWGKIWGYKFLDKNINGVRDQNEPGVGGWTIVLEGTQDDGAAVYQTCVSGDDGYYVFPQVQPGTYKISEIVWPSWQATTQLPIEVSVSGDLENWTLQFDIGNIQYGKIWGYKFLDTYATTYPFQPNGVFDSNEYGLGNWEITLDGNTTEGALVHLVRYTDNIENIGYYEFASLLPGTYTVSETQLSGYWATTQLSKTVMVYAYPNAPVSLRIDFGNLVPSPDPEVNFVLQAGWNMWSTPIDVAGLTAKSLLQEVGPSGLLVIRADKAGNCLQTYMVGGDVTGMLDFPIVVGEGYYVYALQDTVFKLAGNLTCDRTETLTDGWNFIGHDGLKPLMASEMLAKIQGGTGVAIVGYSPVTGKKTTYVAGDDPMYDFEVTPGRAYLVYMIGTGTITYG